MVRALLVRGMVAGLIAGLLSLVFAAVFGEPGIEGGIAFEERATGGGPGVELVSRGVQSTLGLAAALVVFGVAIGGLFGLVYAITVGRVGRLSPRASAAAVALVAFLAAFLVPFLKYPANPPGASEPGTISQRTGLYLVLALSSVVLAATAVWLGHRLTLRLGAWNAGLLACAAYLVVIGSVEYALPPVNETPADFPATVLYQFRLASVGNQLVLWASIGLLFGWWTERSLRRAGNATPQVGLSTR